MRRRLPAADVLLALALGVEMQAELVWTDAPAGALLAARVAVLVLAAAVAARGRAPLLAAAAAIAVLIALERLDPGLDENLAGPFVAVLVIAYSVGAHTEGRRLAAGVIMLGGGCALAILVDEPPGGVDDFVFAGSIVVAGPVLIGRLMRSRAELNRTLAGKAQAADADREARAAGAAAGERARIAGELHHLVRDALAEMVGEAETAERLIHTAPEGAEAALAAVETRGRAALGEIRGLLGVLRREDEELALAPQPSLAHVEDLIARMRASGLAVELAVEGERTALPAGLDLTAYRLLQEALAGALEGPGPCRAAVRLRYEAAELALLVTADGEPALLGLRERVALYGGALETEPGAIRARLPLGRAA
jgi:signal transduction histidine kinase